MEKRQGIKMNVNKLTKELEKRLGVEVRWEDGKIVINGLELIDGCTNDVREELSEVADKACEFIRRCNVDCDYIIMGYEIEIEVF